MEPFHCTPQVCLVQNPEFPQFLGSNLICTSEPPSEISKIQPATPSTNQNSDQILWGGTHLSFWKLFRWFQCPGGESLLQWILLSSGPSLHLRHPLPLHLLLPHHAAALLSAHWICFCFKVCAPIPLCLECSFSGYQHGSLLLSFRFVLCSENHTTLPVSCPASSCSIAAVIWICHRFTCLLLSLLERKQGGRALALFLQRLLDI